MPEDGGLVLARIGQIALPVTDLDRAVAFYRDALGLKMLFQYPGLAFFDCAEVRLMLSAPENGQQRAAGSVIYFRVADIEAGFATLTRRGVAFLDAPHLIARMPDHDLRMAFFRDPDGNPLALMSEVPRQLDGVRS